MKTDLPPFLPELYEIIKKEQIKFISQPKYNVHFDAISEEEILINCVYPCKYCILLYGEDNYLKKEMNNYFKRRLSDVKYVIL